MTQMWKKWLALVLLLKISVAWCITSNAIEIDFMPLSISRNEFLRLRPGTREFTLQQEPYDYMYMPQTKTIAFGQAVRSFARGFVGDEGCAASIGFKETSPAETKALVARLSSLFPTKKTEHQYSASKGTILYLESDDKFSSIIQIPEQDTENFGVVFSMSLKSCSTKVRKTRWQTRP